MAPGNATRYTFVTNKAVPQLKQMGVTEEQVEMMLKEVPRRFLTGEG